VEAKEVEEGEEIHERAMSNRSAPEPRVSGRRRLGWRVALASVWLACANPATEAEPPVLRVGTSGDYAPFSERSGDALRGFDIDVAEAFARARGERIEWVPFRWVELAHDFEAGRFDVVMSGVTVRPDRSVLGGFSAPVVASGAVVLFVRERFQAAQGVAFRDLDQPGVRIAVNRGGHLERVARARFQHARIETRAANDAVRRALAAREVDAVVTDTLEAPHWLAGQTGVGRFGPLTRDRKAYWVAPGRSGLAHDLDRWLLAREADGTLPRLRREWFGAASTEARPTPASALVAAIAERLALMPWVAESKRVAGRPVEDLAREAKVLEAASRAVERAAHGRGVPPPKGERVLDFYRAQIAAAKAIQTATLAGPAQREARAEDLSQTLRPALLRIGDRMANWIVLLGAAPSGEGQAAAGEAPALRATLRQTGVPGHQAEAVVSAFVALGSGVVEAQ